MERAQLTNRSVVREFRVGACAALKRNPDNPILLKACARLARADGDLSDAADLYARLADFEPSAVWTRDLLLGRPSLPLPGPDCPTPFIRLPDFLPAAAQDRLWQSLADHIETFRPTRLGSGHPAALDRATRSSLGFADHDLLRDVLAPRLQSVLTRPEVVGALVPASIDPAPPPLGFTLHGDGDFYREHRDRGVNFPDRRLTLIYYLHRVPRRFEGGDLLLFDDWPADGSRDPLAFTRLEPLHNSLVLFPSDRLHAVAPVTTDSDDRLDGRITVNGWCRPAAAPNPRVTG